MADAPLSFVLQEFKTKGYTCLTVQVPRRWLTGYKKKALSHREIWGDIVFEAKDDAEIVTVCCLIEKSAYTYGIREEVLRPLFKGEVPPAPPSPSTVWERL